MELPSHPTGEPSIQILVKINSLITRNVISNWNLCRGYQYEPNKVPPAPYQIYHASTTVHIEYYFQAKHAGRANISVVDTATATIIKTLKSWDGMIAPFIV
jgi:hypothetical protein